MGGSHRTRTPAVSSAGLRLLARHDLGGHGDGMQVVRSGDALYAGHTGTTGMGTSVLDVTDPARPVLVSQGPGAGATAEGAYGPGPVGRAPTWLRGRVKTALLGCNRL